MRRSIEEKLQDFLVYYSHRRGVGHTTTMIEGAKNLDCCVVVMDQSHARSILRGIPNRKLVTLDNNILHQTSGSQLPLAWDNYTLQCLFSEAVEEIRNLKAQLTASSKPKSQEQLKTPKVMYTIETFDSDGSNKILHTERVEEKDLFERIKDYLEDSSSEALNRIFVTLPNGYQMKLKDINIR